MTQPTQTTENAIQAAGAAVAPRIKPDDIKANIASEHYFTAADGAVGVFAHERAADGKGMFPGDLPTYETPLRLLTFCVLVLRNGFTVTGESACASPENFNADIGRRIARENAVAKIWPLMGYELRTRIANGRTTIADRSGLATPASQPEASTFQDRVRAEHDELAQRIDKLTNFILSPKFFELPKDEQDLLLRQEHSMSEYKACLQKRIKGFDSAKPDNLGAAQ